MLLILLFTLNYSKDCPDYVGEKALKLIAGVGHLVSQMSRQNFSCFHKLDFFPKKQSALKLFQKRLTWTGVYIGGSLAKSWEYGQPQLGGAFKMKKEIMRDSIVLQQFVLFKMQAADIIRSISKQISPTAVCLQLQQNKAASKLFKSLTDKICYVSLLNNFTFVGHLVGYNKETFNGRVPVLENMI